MKLAWSADGRTWSAPVAPHRDKTVSQHGFASLFPTADGGLGLVWLDGRTTRGEEGDMQLRAALFDKSHNSCPTPSSTRGCASAARECRPFSADGPIAALFGNRSAGEIRDSIYVTRLAAGRWTMPVPVHRETTRLRAVP